MQLQKDSLLGSLNAKLRSDIDQLVDLKGFKLLNCLVEGEAFKDNQRIIDALAKQSET